MEYVDSFDKDIDIESLRETAVSYISEMNKEQLKKFLKTKESKCEQSEEESQESEEESQESLEEESQESQKESQELLPIYDIVDENFKIDQEYSQSEEERLFDILENTVYTHEQEEFPINEIEELHSCENHNLDDENLDWNTVIWNYIFTLELSNDKTHVIIKNSDGITIQDFTKAIQIANKIEISSGLDLTLVEYSFNEDTNTVYVNTKFE